MRNAMRNMVRAWGPRTPCSGEELRGTTRQKSAGEAFRSLVCMLYWLTIRTDTSLSWTVSWQSALPVSFDGQHSWEIPCSPGPKPRPRPLRWPTRTSSTASTAHVKPVRIALERVKWSNSQEQTCESPCEVTCRNEAGCWNCGNMEGLWHSSMFEASVSCHGHGQAC